MAPPNFTVSPWFSCTGAVTRSPFTKVPNLELQSVKTGRMREGGKVIEACRLLTDLSSVILKLHSINIVVVFFDKCTICNYQYAR